MGITRDVLNTVAYKVVMLQLQRDFIGYEEVMPMNCSRCGRPLTEAQSYVYQGKVMCEDCILDAGLSIHECDPWATYVDTSTRRRQGLSAAEGMTETEKKIYEYVKSRGKATREEIMRNLSLAETDLNAQLLPLMHSELIKERGEKDKMYLIPIG